MQAPTPCLRYLACIPAYYYTGMCLRISYDSAYLLVSSKTLVRSHSFSPVDFQSAKYLAEIIQFDFNDLYRCFYTYFIENF